MSPEIFEETRRSLFRGRGFSAEPRTLVDPASGFRSYALVRDQGGTPTVLVHGGLAEASVWAGVAGRLDGTVIVVDRPGYGLSDAIDYRGVNFRKHAADWLFGVTQALGASKVNLVGNSMGGYFSLAFAAAHPERVGRLVLPGAPAGLDRELPLFLRLWGNPLFGRLIGAMKFRDIEQLRKRIFPGLVAHPESLPDDALEVGLKASGLAGVGLTSRTMLGALTTLFGVRAAVMLREATAALDIETLFLWGDKDQFAPPESGRELAERMPRASLRVLPDVGHMPQLEVPELVAELTNAFLAAPPSALAAE